MKLYTLILLLKLTSLACDCHSEQPKLLLANTYHAAKPIEITDYWVSEKLDGIRAYWDVSELMTRNGHLIQLPAPLKKTLPNIVLDGELWLGRQSLEKINAIIQSDQASAQQWQDVRYKIFDLPKHKGTFDQRLDYLRVLHSKNPNNFWSPITQFKVKTQTQLEQQLHSIEEKGGEGLMLHLGSSTYIGARTNDLLKVKSFEDAEAIVIGYTQGKGKYRDKTGALIVKMENGNVFNIGSGLSDKDRATPPAIGSIITYKYFGFTHKGIPRFASYLRTREVAK
jgi:DNA ligase-1